MAKPAFLNKSTGRTGGTPQPSDIAAKLATAATNPAKAKVDNLPSNADGDNGRDRPTDPSPSPHPTNEFIKGGTRRVSSDASTGTTTPGTPPMGGAGTEKG